MPFPDHLGGYRTEQPDRGFDLYKLAAETVERDCEPMIARLSWTPGQRRAAIRDSRAALAIVDRAQGHGVQFVFGPYSPLSPPPERRGWRFIGRVYEWQIEQALDDRQHSDAVTAFLKAAQFGMNLTGGDAMDGDLGLRIVAAAAGPLWKALPEMPASELRRLHNALVRILDTAPTPAATIRNERITMLRAVEFVQDAFEGDDLAALREALGDAVGPTIRHMSQMKGEPSSVQVEFFEGLAGDAEAEAERLLQRTASPPHQWTPLNDTERAGPWWRISNHYFRTGRYYLDLWAEQQARLRLLALDAALLAQFKDTEILPGDLSAFPEWLRTDPFSGRSFVFIPHGADFRLYSFGNDRKDDGGQTGAGGAQLDITLGR